MDAERIGAQLNHVDPVYKSQISLIQENPQEKISGKTKKISQEGEIGVFSAEKYFSMKLDNQSPVQTDAIPRNDRDQEHQERNCRTRSKSRSGTPSVRSESSYNSQNFLLRSFNKNNEAVSFGGFRCNGPCSGGKSVNMNPNLNDTRREIQNSRKHIQKPRIHMKNEPRNHITPRIGDFPRGSKIEEFFPLPIEKAEIAVNLERKLSMLTWDAIPKAQDVTINHNNNSASGEDVESVASSDLFEIENITGAYEPSEASIEWSVATRSMADFSVVSDFGEKKFAEKKMKFTNPRPNPKAKSSAGRSGGILSGCKSLKSVNVVEAHRSERKLHAGVRVSDLDFL